MAESDEESGGVGHNGVVGGSINNNLIIGGGTSHNLSAINIHSGSNNNNVNHGETLSHQDRFLPIANVSRIMKKALPANAKISKDAKETLQECVSEFISYITGEASDKCQREKRKTINGDDLLWAMTILGFSAYIAPLKTYLQKFRESEGERSNNSSSQPQNKNARIGGDGGGGAGLGANSENGIGGLGGGGGSGGYNRFPDGSGYGLAAGSSYCYGDYGNYVLPDASGYNGMVDAVAGSYGAINGGVGGGTGMSVGNNGGGVGGGHGHYGYPTGDGSYSVSDAACYGMSESSHYGGLEPGIYQPGNGSGGGGGGSNFQVFEDDSEAPDHRNEAGSQEGPMVHRENKNGGDERFLTDTMSLLYGSGPHTSAEGVCGGEGGRGGVGDMLEMFTSKREEDEEEAVNDIGSVMYSNYIFGNSSPTKTPPEEDWRTKVE